MVMVQKMLDERQTEDGGDGPARFWCKPDGFGPSGVTSVRVRADLLSAVQLFSERSSPSWESNPGLRVVRQQEAPPAGSDMGQTPDKLCSKRSSSSFTK